MIDLNEVVSEYGPVRETPDTHRLILNGKNESHKVYAIRLDKLRYSPHNDRIATWMSQYVAEHEEGFPEDKDEFNAIIEDLIIKSNRDRYIQTRNHIRDFEQQVPGVVLSNGIIVDGNRRFTCLRELAKTDERFNWFNAVILPRELEANPRTIKMLELTIQHGEDTKLEYDPIDRLVGIYRDVVQEGLLTQEEYARYTSTKIGEVKKMLETARLLNEFLDYIDAPGQYYIAREMQLSGPLLEIPRVLRNAKSLDEAESLKVCIFANLVAEPKGDMTRFIRRFSKPLKSENAEAFIAEELNLAEEVSDRLDAMGTTSLDEIGEQIRGDEELVESFSTALEKGERLADMKRSLAAPVNALKDAARKIADVDPYVLSLNNQAVLDEAMGIMGEILTDIESLADQLQGYAQSKDAS